MSSGDALVFLTALHNEPPDDNFATFDTILTTSADEPDDIVPVLDFDPAVDEFSYFSGFMPAHYGGGGVNVTLVWSTEATSGAARWIVAFKSITADVDNIETKAFANGQSGNQTTNGTARVVNYLTIDAADGAQMDNVAADEYFRLEVMREATDVSDSINSNDCELIAVIITEQ